MSCQAWQPEPGLFSVAAVIAVTSPLCPPSFPDEDTEVHRGHLVFRLSWLIGCAVSIQTQIDITPKDVEISLKFSRGQKPPRVCLAETTPHPRLLSAAHLSTNWSTRGSGRAGESVSVHMLVP